MRLIDADALMEKVCGNCQGYDCAPDATDTVYGCELAEIINQMPTIEPEVRHGRWIRNATSEGYHCSNCGHHADSPIGEMIDPRDYECYLDKYCGGCGAQMYADGGTISKERIAEIMAEILR